MFMTAFHCNSSAEDTIRKAAVAGQFYPGDAKSLKSAVEKYLKQVDSSKLGQTPQLLISPHAGFSFSGPVAANGYAALANDIKTVILIGPSHYMRFEGVSIPEVSAYETPLGKVDVNQEMVAKLRKNPVVKSQPGAHAAEHCLEVQLPFLQVKLQHFQIVPILTGRCNPAEIASFVLPLIDEHTVVVASSDLSHYLPQDKAREVDDATIKMIMSGNFSIEGIEGCGAMPIMIIMQIAEKMELKPVLLDTRTSYETAPELGSPSRVVGYTSIGYIKKTPDSTMKDSVTPDPSATAEEHEKGDSTDVESSKGEGNEDISEPDSTSEEQQESSSGLNREIRMYLLTLARESLTAAVKKMADRKSVV
jgi:MEMO1 family protein